MASQAQRLQPRPSIEPSNCSTSLMSTWPCTAHSPEKMRMKGRRWNRSEIRTAIVALLVHVICVVWEVVECAALGGCASWLQNVVPALAIEPGGCVRDELATLLGPIE
ncbi:hypothetical protein D3C76_1587820 [compost metagenome]